MTKWTPFWEQKHVFVVYRDQYSATQCLEALQNFEERKKRCDDIKKALVTAGKSEHDAAVIAPRPNFYVRVPKDKKKPKSSPVPVSSTSSQTISAP